MHRGDSLSFVVANICQFFAAFLGNTQHPGCLEGLVRGLPQGANQPSDMKLKVLRDQTDVEKTFRKKIHGTARGPKSSHFILGSLPIISTPKGGKKNHIGSF